MNEPFDKSAVEAINCLFQKLSCENKEINHNFQPKNKWNKTLCFRHKKPSLYPMKITCRLLLPTLLLLLSQFITAQNVQVMSYNIRYKNGHDGQNSWCRRKATVVKLIKKYNPDIIGTQEALDGQMCYLKRKLRKYKAVGVGRNNGKRQGEYAAIFYHKDSFTLEQSGTFWLSEAPEQVGSIGWDAGQKRIATWCRLKHKRTSKVVYVFNTHLDNQGPMARKNGARLIKQKIREIAGNADVLLTGDFNATPEEAPYKVVITDEGGFALRDIAGANNESTFCMFEVANTNCSRLDYIFCSGMITPVAYSVISDNNGTYYPSDHKPVTGTVQLSHKP